METNKQRKQYQKGYHAGFINLNGSTPNLRFRMGYKRGMQKILDIINFLRKSGDIGLLDKDYKKICMEVKQEAMQSQARHSSQA